MEDKGSIFTCRHGDIVLTIIFFPSEPTGHGDVLLADRAPLVVIRYWCRISRGKRPERYTCGSRKPLVLFYLAVDWGFLVLESFSASEH